MVACLLGVVVIVLRGEGPHPRIVGIYPPNGDRYWPGGIAQITFSQSMDEASVERALQVSPGSQGQGSWYGNTLNLQPSADWKDNVTYHLSLRGTVTDDQGRPLLTPVSFWFRVHRVRHVAFCRMHGVRNLCEPIGRSQRALTLSPQPVLQYALSPDASILAYTRRDSSGLPHLFLLQLDGSGTLQITHGRRYADSSPFWTTGDSQDVSYYRRPVVWQGKRAHFGRPRLWNVQIDGSDNAAL
jgi:hypothetical protein